jgi:RHS repeat-associated protein
LLIQSNGALAQSQDTAVYYHIDAIGSVRMVTDANQQVIARYDYLPFGEPWTAPSDPDVRQFAGKERDSETGFDYYGARYYSPRQGRFTSPDPAGYDLTNPQTFNKYRYALNNPLHYIDRDGLYEESVHRDLTVVLALAVGFSRERAMAIGGATQWVDDDPRTNPVALRNLLDEEMRANYHFTSETRRADMWGTFERTGSITALGEYMHALQDSFAHQGFEARYGHAKAGKAPDKTTNDPARADRMAEAAYGKLLLARGRIRAANPAIPFERIEELVQKFNRAGDTEKGIAIEEIRRRILQERQ